MSTDTRNFHLQRDEDISGVSGTGIVADGCVFPDGVAVVRWRGERQSTVVWPSIDDVKAIHGHGGATRIVWHDASDASTDTPTPERVTPPCVHCKAPEGEHGDRGACLRAGFYGNRYAPERATLTAEERMMGHPMHLNDVRAGVVFFQADVEHILAAREQALREEVQATLAGSLMAALGSTESRDIVAAMLMDAAYRMDDPQHRGHQYRWPKHAAMFRNLADTLFARGGAR